MVHRKSNQNKFILIQISPFLKAVKGCLDQPINPLIASDFPKIYLIYVKVSESVLS
jgi:hypothetical protein